MKVVLTQDVPNLGRAGDVKEVSSGYARNYLLPRKLAVVATDAALKQLEQKRAAIERQAERQAEEVRALARRIEGTELRFRARAADNRLYGSIQAHEIAEQLSKAIGHEIDKREVALPEPLKTTGAHLVTIRLARSVTPQVRVIIEAE